MGPRDHMDNDEISFQLQKKFNKLLCMVTVIMESDVNNEVMLLKAFGDLVQSGTVLLRS